MKTFIAASALALVTSIAFADRTVTSLDEFNRGNPDHSPGIVEGYASVAYERSGGRTVTSLDTFNRGNPDHDAGYIEGYEPIGWDLSGERFVSSLDELNRGNPDIDSSYGVADDLQISTRETMTASAEEGADAI